MNKIDEERTLRIVLELLKMDKAAEAKKLFSEITTSETVQYWMVKGNLEQKFQNWGGAINAYNHVLDLDANNTEAENNLHIIQNIINFWNPEMFNP
jgi:phosphoribosylformimino-5-aminoimidazole carboxamide ribonucleotide (ProFAR) isomerase